MTIPATIKNRDDGKFKCEVTDLHNANFSDTKHVNIIDEHFVKLYEDNGQNVITIVSKRKAARINIGFTAYPTLTNLVWTNNRGVQISSNGVILRKKKYAVEKTDKSIILTVRDPDLNDFGTYTLTASNDFTSNSITVKLHVLGKCFLESSKSD